MGIERETEVRDREEEAGDRDEEAGDREETEIEDRDEEAGDREETEIEDRDEEAAGREGDRDRVLDTNLPRISSSSPTPLNFSVSYMNLKCRKLSMTENSTVT